MTPRNQLLKYARLLIDIDILYMYGCEQEVRSIWRLATLSELFGYFPLRRLFSNASGYAVEVHLDRLISIGNHNLS